ncbi:MAG: hypothetical protein LBD01_05155 [Puniceicoccales bacterium]|jgi:hypothetical protein|nr:hypothetical protein [Puniceicoccales bacterium]
MSAITAKLVDCLNGEQQDIRKFPYLLHASTAHGHLALAELELYQGDLVLSPSAMGVGKVVLINGQTLSATVSLQPGEEYPLRVGGRLLLLKVDAEENWPPVFDHKCWQVFSFSSDSAKILAEAQPSEISILAISRGWDTAVCAVCPKGLYTGFTLSSVVDVLEAPPQDDSSENFLQPAIAVTGRYTCPSCWLRFDSGDTLSIATHSALCNDPVLGPDTMLRFSPTHFNDYGQAIDPMGIPSAEIACPHCRRRLSPGFLDISHKIFSLIGAPSSGKSYFLAVLTRILQEQLFKDFGLVFKDGDPTGNMLLNQMRTKLFSGVTPEECVLGKTALEGSTYERLPRMGKWVMLPRPFVYILDDERSAEPNSAAIVFYDNAGEHFEPGLSMEESPGALHVVQSAGIFFLYDPTSNPRFRRALADSTDPQLYQRGRADQQDSILAEMEVRIKRMLGLAPMEKVPMPIAILIGKCDIWQELLGAPQLPSPVKDGYLDQSIVDANSKRLRELLVEFCPGLVAHAETLSHDVRYFAVSSLGHSPQPLTSGANQGLLTPDPQKLAPIGIEAPAYWLLNKAFPKLIPSVMAILGKPEANK